MNGCILNSRKIQMTNKVKMKNIKQVIDDIEISDIEPQITEDEPAFPVEKFMKTLDAVDWKLSEILQILQKWDKEEDEQEQEEQKSDD